MGADGKVFNPEEIKPMKAVVAIALSLLCLSAFAQEWRVSSDQTVGGFKFPESAAYDPKGKVLYVGNFGGEKLAPAEKDGLGYISKVGLDGKVIEERWVPAKGGEAMNKPKGIWIAGNRLWVTDIDAVWIFDLKSKKGRKLALPGVGFANDPAVMGKALYISDNRNDKLVKVEPADFLNARNPQVTEVVAGMGYNPNGIFAPDKPKNLYALGVSGQIKTISDPVGRIDGLYEMKDGTILFTDWNTSSLSIWNEKTDKVHVLAAGFKGPADFTVIPNADGSLTAVVPDLVQSHLRFIQLRKN
jgi:DNA-binding beta-propeller fold protein YncE